MITVARLAELLSEFDARERKVLLGGAFATQVVLSAGAARDAVPGDCVCVGAQGPAPPAVPTVDLALATPLAAAGRVLGVLLDPIPRGGSGYCAMLGVLTPGTTGLGASAGKVRVNPLTARCQRVPSLSEGDFAVGIVDPHGNLTLGLLNDALAGGGGGGSVPALSTALLADAGTAVDPGNQDGSIGAPYSTLQPALDVLDEVESHAVVVAPGLYLDAITLNSASDLCQISCLGLAGLGAITVTAGFLGLDNALVAGLVTVSGANGARFRDCVLSGGAAGTGGLQLERCTVDTEDLDVGSIQLRECFVDVAAIDLSSTIAQSSIRNTTFSRATAITGGGSGTVITFDAASFRSFVAAGGTTATCTVVAPPTIVAKTQVTVAHAGTHTGQTTVETTAALAGALVGDSVKATPTTNMPAGFAFSHARISAPDTLAVGISRLPVSTGTPGSVTYDVTLTRAP